MGNSDSKRTNATASCFKVDKSSSDVITTSKKQQQKNHRTYQKNKLKCTKQDHIGFCLQTPPILNNKMQIILLSSSSCTNTTMYKILDLKQNKIIDTQEIKCNDDNNFDVINTVYTLNTKTNEIYLIENNKDIKILDLSKNEIKSLNKIIKITNNNHAQIQYINDDEYVYILGAEQITNNPDDDEKDDNEYPFINVPYSLCKRFHGGKGTETERIRNFGKSTTIATIKQNKNYVYIMGGQLSNKLIKGDGVVISGDIYVCEINADKSLWKNFDEREMNRCYALPKWMPLHSFGAINYKNKYLFLFGGVEWPTRDSNSRGRKSSNIRVLPLTKDDEYKLEYMRWYSIDLKLPRDTKGEVHVIYPGENNPSEIAHLFTYDGQYYTFEMKQIFEAMRDVDMTDYSHNLLSEWSKGMVPTEIKEPFIKFNTKENIYGEIDQLLKDLDLTKYRNEFCKVKLRTFSDIVDAKNTEKLKAIVTNEDDLKMIKNKATASIEK